MNLNCPQGSSESLVIIGSDNVRALAKWHDIMWSKGIVCWPYFGIERWILVHSIEMNEAIEYGDFTHAQPWATKRDVETICSEPGLRVMENDPSRARNRAVQPLTSFDRINMWISILIITK